MFKTYKKKSIARILIYYLIVIASVIAVSTTFLSYTFLSHRSKLQYEQRLEEYLVYLKDSLELPIWRMDRSAFEKICKSFAKNDEIGMLKILDEDGEFIFETEPANEPDLIQNHVDIRHRNEVVGKIVLGLKPSYYKQKNKELLFISIFMASVMILGLVVSIRLVLNTHLRKPLNDLIQRIKEIASGNYHQVTKEYEQREIDSISSEFNRMADQIRHREMSLVEAKKELENEIIQRKRMKDQLQQAQKMEAIGTLAGGIAHDFNNILSSIIGFGELVQEDLKPDSRTYSMQKRLIKSGLRARDLVHQILLFSRQSEIETKPVQPHLIIKEALKLLRASIPSSIEIKQNINSDCGHLLADPTQIHQIIMNLFTNAYHAIGDEGGTLTISLSSANITEEDISFSKLELDMGSYIIISIADTGHGMDAETVAKIFNPYFTTKPKGEGTGLGLAVVHGIVKNMGGIIKVYSEIEKGTNIQVYFPRLDLNEERSEHAKKVMLPRGSEHVCIVDDEQPILEIMQIGLENLGYNVTPFINAQDALDDFSHNVNKYDLIITDLTMPKMTGIEFVSKILEFKPNFPIIMCTGFSELINQKKAEALGIRAFLTKPVLKSDLAFAVYNSLK